MAYRRIDHSLIPDSSIDDIIAMLEGVKAVKVRLIQFCVSPPDDDGDYIAEIELIILRLNNKLERCLKKAERKAFRDMKPSRTRSLKHGVRSTFKSGNSSSSSSSNSSSSSSDSAGANQEMLLKSGAGNGC